MPDYWNTRERPLSKGDVTVIDLTAVTEKKLGAMTSLVDIYMSTAGDVFMGFEPAPDDSTAPYEIAARSHYQLDVSPDDALTLYFAPITGSFTSGDIVRLVEWGS